jgi:type I restriction enzyme S subunit
LRVSIDNFERDQLAEQFGLGHLGDYVSIQSGFAFRSGGFVFDDNGAIPILGGESIGHGEINWNSGKRWPVKDLAGFESYLLEEDDLVLAMDRPWISTGLKLARLRSLDLPALLIQRTARIKCHSNMNARFLELILMSEHFSKYLLASQTGASVPHVSSKQIANYEIPVPPISDQRLLADKRSQIYELLSRLDSGFSAINLEAESITKSILISAFTGVL